MTAKDRQTETLIIGGGLSGLSVAARLADRGRRFDLLDARPRFGGRVLTAEAAGGQFDLGPAWIWPGQPRIRALVEALGAEIFEQHAAGDALYEAAPGHVQRMRGAASMAGSWRVAGGMARLVEGLVRSLAPANLHLNAHVTAMAANDTGVTVTTADDTTWQAEHVVLAMPPRLIAEMQITPEISFAARGALTRVPTWMAGQAKLIAVYDRPFWREQGASGDAISRVGPLVEMHDASDVATGLGAMFGFVGVPPAARLDDTTLKSQAVAQLARLFGPEAEHPIAVLLHDWARDAVTATPADQRPVTEQPQYRPLDPMLSGRVIVAGTEASAEFGGYIEGALAAAEAAVQALEIGPADGHATTARPARCELSIGCPFDPSRVGWSYQAPTLFGGIE